MQSDEQRFLMKVLKRPGEGCWIWKGTRNRDGYGMFGVGGRQPLAHRWAYTHFVGAIPKGLCVLHRCDTPPCVNPQHLFVGTQAENVADCVAKGRRNQARFRRLSPELHTEIADLYAAGNVSQEAIARRFGVSQPTVGYIVRKTLT